MSVINSILWSIFELAGLDVIEDFVERHRRHKPPVAGRFAGNFTVKQGVIIMAGQEIPVGVPFKGTITYINAENGPAKAPPIAAVALDNPAAGSVVLDPNNADYSFTLTATGDVNLTFTGTNEKGDPVVVPPLALSGIDSIAVAGSFGTPVPA